MDELDLGIMKMLKADSRASFVEIAKKFGITEGAVRLRVKKLVGEKAIRKFTIETAEGTMAVVMVSTSRSIPTSKVSGAIKGLGIDRVYEVSGSYDIICFIEAESIGNLNSTIERIRSIQGVEDTQTSMVLK
jgi:DNA-binding Lrp family transcriptional regulator